MNLVYADFMKTDYEGRLRLVCIGTRNDLAKFNIELKSGMRLVFYNDDVDDERKPDDLVVEGIVEYNEELKEWAARIDWAAIKNISELSSEEKRRLGLVLDSLSN